MSPNVHPASTVVVCVLLAVLAAAVASGCGEKDEPAPETPAPEAEAGSETAPGLDPGDADAGQAGEGGGDKPQKPQGGAGSGPAESGSSDPRSTAAERAVMAAVRAYIAAIDARNGERVCELLAPGAVEAIELPRERGECADSVSASIGYRDPRGLPVFERARLAELASVELDGAAAKVVATVVTTFADRTEPSIEDDVVYLERTGTRWAVAKPSTTLYRSVGIADVPPSVLTPP
jgi:hypothetical protein